MVNVLLVDDEPRLLRAWSMLFADHPEFRVVGTLPQADGLREMAERTMPQVVVLDLTMPGLHPVAAIRQLSGSLPGVRILVYSARNDREMMREAVDAGAWGYVDKMCRPEEMFNAVRRVAAGEVVLPSCIAGA